ncbi:hypothetical protein PAXRUDRAFT_823707 [Paxillus rubicundulus Ve08.2h10]|uniref:Unplaced genomic scaffold scaffold_65, whole genome shotgun sequence n=1 Tax=Paxillus rubicundulus Ve08.2h10 TaxID=930991 RepID=A0A0D0E377_9AGAM|nr:hypothetical protein PAXRUDRAFT_823707 [Paxillus rubicundulus Ve08.2h10]
MPFKVELWWNYFLIRPSSLSPLRLTQARDGRGRLERSNLIQLTRENKTRLIVSAW